MSSPRWTNPDEMKFVSATKWREACVVQSWSGLRQRYQSSCVRDRERDFHRPYDDDECPTVQNFSIRQPSDALPCDHLAIASTHDSSSRYLRQEEITRRSMISVDPFRTAGIGSALDPADRTCARSRRAPLARPAYARDRRDSARWRNKPSGRRV